MKINKLFHWLYAFLMVLPFLALIYNFVRFSLSGDMTVLTFSQVNDMFLFPGVTSSANSLYTLVTNCFYSLLSDVFGINCNYWVESGYVGNIIVRSLTYWTLVSIIWLCFDFLMFLPMWAHKVIDNKRKVF